MSTRKQSYVRVYREEETTKPSSPYCVQLKIKMPLIKYHAHYYSDQVHRVRSLPIAPVIMSEPRAREESSNREAQVVTTHDGFSERNLKPTVDP